MAEPGFYKIPLELWEKVIAEVGRQDLLALTLASKKTFPVANPILYKTIEASFCKSSQSYYEALSRTISNNFELAALVTELLIDMKVSCKVKTMTSKDDLKAPSPSRTWGERFRQMNVMLPMGNVNIIEAKGKADWNREAVQTLRLSTFLGILPKLPNIQKITVILGDFQSDPSTLSELLENIPQSVFPSLRHLKIYDTSFQATAPLKSMSHLRIIDLGYVSIENVNLCTLFSQNFGTLEEVRLHWIMELKQQALFSGFTGPPLKNLKAFTYQGSHICSTEGLKTLLGKPSSLHDFRLDSLSTNNTHIWTEVLSGLATDDTVGTPDMRILKFGAPTACQDFWESVLRFFLRCGNKLTSIVIKGSPKGARLPLPSGFFKYFREHPQPELTSLVLMWRDDVGLALKLAGALASFCPFVKMLHTCLSFPSDPTETLIRMISPFPNLSRVHLTFFKHAALDGLSQSESEIEVNRYTAIIQPALSDIARKGTKFQEFIYNAAIGHPDLSEVSWSIYDRIRFSDNGPKAYVRIHREAPPKPHAPGWQQIEIGYNRDPTGIWFKDLALEYQELERMDSTCFSCTVGSKKVLLNQKPGWREDMGNIFLKERRMCQDLEFGTGGDPRPRLRGL